MLGPDVIDWSGFWQLFAGFVVAVGGILLSLAFGAVSGNLKIGNDFC